jgi:hypothetical protein
VLSIFVPKKCQAALEATTIGAEEFWRRFKPRIMCRISILSPITLISKDTTPPHLMAPLPLPQLLLLLHLLHHLNLHHRCDLSLNSLSLFDSCSFLCFSRMGTPLHPSLPMIIIVNIVTTTQGLTDHPHLC